MARYKLIKSKFEPPQFLIAKKRERIQKVTEIIYVVLMVIGIFVCGINQYNDAIVGWIFIVLGLISVPMSAFYLYMQVKKWEPVFWYDYTEARKYISKKERQKDIEEHNILRIFLIVVLTLFSIALPILGIVRLTGM